GRVDALEARTAELEANQFSTTTVLRGRTIFSLADIFGVDEDIELSASGTERNILGEDDTNTVFQSRVRLNFDTSFTGEDRLRARLQWGNFVDFAQTADAGTNAIANDTLFAAQNSFSYATNTSGNVRLSRLEYYFPVGDATTVYIEAQGGSISDIVSSISSFDDPEQGSISYFGYNPIYDIAPGTGIGAGLTFDFSDNLQLGLGYLSGTGNDPNDGRGLFNGDYAAFGQLTFGLGDSPLTAALTYVNSYRDNSIVNAYGVSAQFAINDAFFVGGWVSYYDSDELDGAGDSRFWTYAGTLGVADLGVEGSLLGLIVGVPPRRTDFEVAGSRRGGGIDDAALHAELFYRLPLTDNITLTPGIIWLQDPGNNNDNDDLVIGALRTSFSF
ncbi:MAG: carbohydrate porin, partial [Leptolyngbyaceae cyanobacterium SM1_3_5]|nr:carbohydrate porin [Leptolyngbyaceae cyanobacterium SM1_3_5]